MRLKDGGHDPEAAGPWLKISGMALASASVAFAGSMLFGGAPGKPSAPGSVLAWHQGTGVLGGYDYEPTGTIRVTTPTGSADASRHIEYRLREAEPSSAVIEGPPGRLLRVKPGMSIPQAGRVIAIRRRDDHWSVVTSSSTIE